MLPKGSILPLDVSTTALLRLRATAELPSVYGTSAWHPPAGSFKNTFQLRKKIVL